MAIDFNDGLWCYRLGPQGRRETNTVRERDVRSVLRRWLAREPWRGHLRRYAAAEMFVQAQTDDGLIDRICALLQMRGLQLRRVERKGLRDIDVFESDAEPLVEQGMEGIVDWKFRCKHTFDGEQRTTDRDLRLMVVPGPEPRSSKQSDKTDTVTVLFRDDINGAPGSLTATPSVGAAVTAPSQGDQGGGYHAYEIPVEFHGDTRRRTFLSQAFGQTYNLRTTYTVRGASSPITIDVMYPYEWRLKFSLPPLRTFKAGARLEQEVGRSDGGARAEISAKAKCEDWVPSSLTATSAEHSKRASAEVTPTSLTLESEEKLEVSGKKAFGGISLERSDGLTFELKELNLIAAIAENVQAFFKIVKSIKNAAPQVGWFVDFDVQFFQGSVSAAWGWREYEDHRVFQWIDTLIDIKILDVSAEVGVGIGMLSFKAQLYAKLQGTVKATFDGQRPSPDASDRFTLAYSGTIVGSLGARFEAGNVFKIDGHGETGIQIDGRILLNEPGRPFALEESRQWTGIKVVLTVSCGIFGIGGTKVREAEPISPMSLGSWSFPREKEKYNPAYLADARIGVIIEDVLTEGLNIRVIKSGDAWFGLDDESWTVHEIVSALMGTIGSHPTLRRDKKTIEGLAHAIRSDLDELGSRWLRDYVEEKDFHTYVQSRTLGDHLDAAIDMGLELMRSTGVSP